MTLEKQQLNRIVTYWVAISYLVAILVFLMGFAVWFKLSGHTFGNCQPQSTENAPVDAEADKDAEVLQVFDGDTFSAQIDGKTEIVRAIGIDAPETGEKYTSKECFAEQAKQRASELLEGKSVKLRPDPTQDDRDRYDRLLRYVWLSDGTFFNQLMVEEGFAREYAYKDMNYEKQADFARAEQTAREKGLGLWGECH